MNYHVIMVSPAGKVVELKNYSSKDLDEVKVFLGGLVVGQHCTGRSKRVWGAAAIDTETKKVLHKCDIGEWGRKALAFGNYMDELREKVKF